jgi:hypothetical protein
MTFFDNFNFETLYFQKLCSTSEVILTICAPILNFEGEQYT